MEALLRAPAGASRFVIRATHERGVGVPSSRSLATASREADQLYGEEQPARRPRGRRALVLVLACCGLRWGEAIALRVRDVEFLRRRLSVSENAVQLSVNHAVGPTKGRKARSVPVPAFVLNEPSAQCQGKDPSDLVFPGHAGGYLPRPKSAGGWFAAAVTKAKVQKITPHDLRHTCASLAVSAGVNVLALQRMLGHTSAKVTLDTYADLFDDDLDAVAVTLDRRYSREGVAKMWPQGNNDAR